MATKDRIYIDKEFEEIADMLVKRRIPNSESTQGIFRDTRELVAFAAGIGYCKNRSHKVTSSGREIKISALEGIEKGGRQLLINAIAIAKTGSVDILKPDKEIERAKILEGYLNGGLEYISGMSDDKTSLETVMEIIKAEFAHQEQVEKVVDNLSRRKI